ncbi:MAG TPA: class I SAM-dependent methyltransferase [Solirubrobacteraceae bacterium]|jgi:predicted O-methyltransferase YrrM|nr:class I SAM-dependent methyltransferase [Solirubrobacteraceae bacterium]
MRFEDVANAVQGVPFMSPAHGRRVYDHVRETRPERILELGSGYGVGAAYMAAALHENGSGRLTTVDYSIASFDPRPETLLTEVGLAEHVEVVRDFSTYTWFLKERIEERSDPDGNCEPVYDFVYLDGSKNWTVDGLAVFLIEKLLRPGGWLLMDDLHWRYADSEWAHLFDGNGRPFGPLSPREREQPHLRAVFDLIVMQHPAFNEFRIEDDWFGWARKLPGQPRRFELRSSRPLAEVIATRLRRAVRRHRRVRPHSTVT